MSERVKELAKQAGWYDDKEFASWNKIYQWQNFDKEKFAELIVKECADVAWKDSARYATFDNDTVMNGKADVLALCSHHIKQHFGVEE